MTRTYDDPVVVRSTDDEGADFRPGAFLWRGRLYVVHEVLGHWCERRAWWSGAAARALHGDAEAVERSGTATLEAEREVWRVEASRGRSYASGVFDLSREVPSSDDTWRLLGVSD